MKLEKETRLKLAIGLSSVFVVVEVIGGYIANSIAIYSDAAHLLTDIAGFGIALIAVVASKAPGTKHLTFGLARAEVFGALGSIASLWVITAFLLYAAYCRAYGWFTGNADDVNGFFMFLVACFGVLVNICLGLVFQEDHGGDFHPSHSSCGHDHSHDGSHAHAHENAQTSAYVKVPVTDLEHGHDSADHSSCGGGHDHGHDHNHKKDSKKNNNSIKNTTKSPLIDDHSHGAHSYQSMEDGGHDHGHGHASSASHAEHAEHDHSTCGGHDHAEVAHDAHDHSTCGGHGHDEHDHAPHNLIEATLKSPTDVNIEAAYLHVLTDLIQSIGVAIAGLCIWFKPHWQIIDPLCTFIFSFVALRSTIPLLKRVFTILLEGTPSHVDWEHVMTELKAIRGVQEVHDLHIWSISSKSTSLTVHIRAYEPQSVLRTAHKVCLKLGIDHATIQVQDATDEGFCFSQSCDSHNPDAGQSKSSSCVLSNHLEVSSGSAKTGGVKQQSKK